MKKNEEVKVRIDFKGRVKSYIEEVEFRVEFTEKQRGNFNDSFIAMKMVLQHRTKEIMEDLIKKHGGLVATADSIWIRNQYFKYKYNEDFSEVDVIGGSILIRGSYTTSDESKSCLSRAFKDAKIFKKLFENVLEGITPPPSYKAWKATI